MSIERGPVSLLHPETDASWPLIRFLLDDPVYRAGYLAHVQSVLDEAFVPGDVQRQLSAARALIAPYVLGPEGEVPGYTHLHSPSDFETAHQELMDHIPRREQAVRDALAGSR